MFGLAVLFFLGLWVLITLGATLLGRKIGRKVFNNKGGTKGAIIGFMLTMGGWFVYWIGEYVYIQYTVTKLCDSEGGLTVYVTPEQWRKQIGEEEWNNLPYVGRNVDYTFRTEFRVVFEGLKYKPSTRINRRVIEMGTGLPDGSRNIGGLSYIYYDTVSGQVLYKIVAYGVPYSVNKNFFKPWFKSIEDCSWTTLPYSVNSLASKQYTNASLNNKRK